jgi:hypothetical protein
MEWASLVSQSVWTNPVQIQEKQEWDGIEEVEVDCWGKTKTSKRYIKLKPY